jgi:hypothetical protein
MNGGDWLAASGLALTLLLNLAGYLVAWGALKSTVKGLADRVSAHEADVDAVGELRVQIARVETRLDGLLEQFRDLNSAIRWMRIDTMPAPDPSPAPAATAPRKRGRA